MKQFTLVDTEGNEITEKEQLGLLLYRGGKVLHYYHFDYRAADVICKHMNFTHAATWTTEENFQIQSNYDVNLDGVLCEKAEWDSCRFYEEYSSSTWSRAVYLSCTGKR